MADIDKELATELKAALKAKRQFGFIAAPEKVLVVSKTKPDVKAMKLKAGGGSPILGTCRGIEGVLVFETKGAPPGGLEAKLKQAIKASAGLSMNVEVRQAGETDGDEEANETTPSPEVVEESSKPSPSKTTGEEPKKGSFVALQTCRLAWDTARKKAQQEITALQKAILAKAKGEPDAAEIAKIVKDFEKTKTALDTGLIELMDQALNAQPDARPALYAQVVRMISAFQAKVTSDPFLSDIDNNPFLPVTVNKTLMTTLTLLASKLK